MNYQKNNNPERKSLGNGKLRQYIIAVIVDILSLSCGIIWGWPSPVNTQLRSSTPPIGNESMTDNQISWINSWLAIGGLITVPFCGSLGELMGRKNFAHLSGFVHIASWLLIIFAKNFNWLCAARFVGGTAIAMTLFIVPLYVSEISSKNIRGSLSSLLIFFVNVGVLFAYVFGAYASYEVFAYVSMSFTLVFVAIFGFMPETPVYLARRECMLQAHKSLMFLRGNNRVLVEEELANLQSSVQSSNNCSSNKKQASLIDVLRDRATRKGLIISIGLLAAQQLSGIFAMICHAEMIFHQVNSPLSAEMASIFIAAIQIVSSCASTLLMDRAGRRPLSLISCLGMAISHIIVGTFFWLQDNHYDVSFGSWLPFIALSVYMVNYCLGIGPVSIIVIAEIFSVQVSSLASTLCFVFYWILSFVSIQAFGIMNVELGVGPCFIMFAAFCLASLVFTYYFLPETKNRELQDIVDELAGPGFCHGKSRRRDTGRVV